MFGWWFTFSRLYNWADIRLWGISFPPDSPITIFYMSPGQGCTVSFLGVHIVVEKAEGTLFGLDWDPGGFMSIEDLIGEEIKEPYEF